MNRGRLGVAAVALVGTAALGCLGAVQLRETLSLLFPIYHTGKVLRISQFSKGGYSSQGEDTRQLNQFAIFFEDGFDCEGYDTSFAAIREGDTVKIRAYHDVRPTPFIGPEWWECDGAQLEQLIAQAPE